MNLTIIGTGYVGLVTGIGLAKLGFNVTCIDKDEEKIRLLNDGILPIYEPGLDELLKLYLTQGNLKFSSELAPALTECDAVFIAVGTPTREEDQGVDLSFVFKAAEELRDAAPKDLTIIVKSTVAPGTNKALVEVFREGKYNFNVISNPEFLREGLALHDFLYPDRIILGIRNESDKAIMEKIYHYFSKQNVPFFYSNPESAELAKYAANGFLATKIAFINEIANLCEKLDADVQAVSEMIGSDKRIGNQFLQAGPAFGGSCFPKDIAALRQIALESQVDLSIINAVITSNENRKSLMVAKIVEILGNLQGKKLCCLGLAFKANTDDVRESPAIAIISLLSSLGAKLKLYDPQAMANAQMILSDEYEWCSILTEAVEDSEAIIILTEWPEFKEMDLAEIRDLMTKACIIDLRNILNPEKVKKSGFYYYNIGNANIC